MQASWLEIQCMDSEKHHHGGTQSGEREIQGTARSQANFRIDSLDEVVPGCTWNYRI